MITDDPHIKEVFDVVNERYPSKRPPFLTGSRAFDMPHQRVSSPDSDYDIMVDKGAYSNQKHTEHPNCNHTESSVLNSTILLFKEFKINVIPLIPYEYKAWQFATNSIIKLMKDEPGLYRAICYKPMRVAIFEQMKATYKIFSSMDCYCKSLAITKAPNHNHMVINTNTNTNTEIPF